MALQIHRQLHRIATSSNEGGDHAPAISSDITSLATQTLALGQFYVPSTTLSQPIPVTVPDGAFSFELSGVAADITSRVVVYRITDPSGVRVYDYGSFSNPIKILPSPLPGSFSVLVPNSPSVPLPSGTWNFYLVASTPTWATVQAEIKTYPGALPSTGKLDLNLFFVGVPTLNAQTAANDPSFQQVLTKVRNVYSQVGLALGNVTYIDILGADATRFADVAESDLGSLFQLSSNPQATDNAVNIFLVHSIVGGGLNGYTILGESGGIPGTPIRGTTSSGLAVTTANFPLGLDDIALTAAHETSHWLGLFHTTEARGNSFDPLPDTPQCPVVPYDTNLDGIMEPQECVTQDATNLMFWTSVATIPASILTPNQGFVMLRNPIVTPPTPIPVTIASAPAGRTVSVSGDGCQAGSYTAPQTLSWAPGSSCLVSFASPQSGTTGTQYVFNNWADDATAPASRTLATPAAPITYTANFTTQYLLTTVASPASEGSISPASRYVNAGSTVKVSATPKPGFVFFYFSGGLTGQTNPQNLIVSAPVTATANFDTPQNVIAQMINYVQVFLGTLPDASDLISKLNGISAKLSKGQTGAACYQLTAFVNELYDDVNSGLLPVNKAQPLINVVKNIKIGIGC